MPKWEEDINLTGKLGFTSSICMKIEIKTLYPPVLTKWIEFSSRWHILYVIYCLMRTQCVGL